jgi:hypothetical protein
MGFWILMLTLYVQGDQQTLVLQGPFQSADACMAAARYEAHEANAGMEDLRSEGFKVDGFALTCDVPGFKA